MSAKQQSLSIQTRLEKTFPEAKPALNHHSDFEFLVAVILSAQTTDVQVNKATPALFVAFPTPAALAAANLGTVEKLIHSLGFYRTKAKAIVGAAKVLVEQFGGEVPQSLDELITFPGVGRKTANVVLGQAFGIASGIAVDTHVKRIAFRLGLTRQTDPIKVEQDLMKQFPQAMWPRINLVWVLFGRQICVARQPKCFTCPLTTICPKVGILGY